MNIPVRETVVTAGLLQPGTIVWCRQAGRYLPVKMAMPCSEERCPHAVCVVVRFPLVGGVHYAADAALVAVVIDV